MLLAIPGDNTFSNYQEANRTFWRQTVLPIVQRITDAFNEWLAPSASETLRFEADLDDIAALNDERDALWARLEKTTFLSNDEKRVAVGYAPSGTANAAGEKFNPGQLRKPPGKPGGGQWAKPGGDSSGAVGGGRTSDTDEGDEIDQPVDGADNPIDGETPSNNSDDTDVDPAVIPVAGKKPGGIPKAVMDWTVRKFVSSYCRGGINSELPGQFEDMTIADVLKLAQGGDAAARTCAKLLKEPRFRK